ncbi:PBSX family phage terminase large subunit [Stenotrophomonas rhizophila]|uniref:PBSX family phage terminase large subunit n=1 Tax=Stenotrophomonas rhizophila TaxID=216778 RepID=A0A498CMC1_9GAMM|nr:PBSX family phage terminase large subunit [Stenotrophomonas rhizophila]RLK56244.1 PBSX family phage terminase large subunit [Stenotrophomonas rhizophila]
MKRAAKPPQPRKLEPHTPLTLPVKLIPVLKPRQFKVLYGGRGSAKSHSVAQILVMLSMQAKHRILCVREIQKSISQSSKRVIEDYIHRMGLSAYFKINKKAEDGITCLLTGSTFSFSGLQDHTADSIKSFEGATLVWVEEASNVSANSWNKLIPTIVRTTGAEIWVTFNPDQEDDYAYKRWVLGDDPDATVIQINWKDNPWWNPAMETERLKTLAISQDLHDHIFGGQPRARAGILFKRHWFKRFNLGEEPGGLRKYLASDYAGAPDADDPEADPDWTEHGCAGLDHVGDIWFTDWWSGQEDPSVWINAWLQMIRRSKPLIAFEEKGVILRAVDGAINKAMREKQTFIHREGLASAGSKADRALGFAARAATGSVHIPNTDWGDRLIDQLCAFTGEDGKRDDMVDVGSLLARGLDLMSDGSLPPEKKAAPAAAFTDKWFAQRDAADRADEERAANYYR